MAKVPAKQPEVLEMPKQRSCGTMVVHERLMRTDPAYARARAASENRHFEYLRRGPTAARTGVTVIPVVVHVVYKTSQQNISDEQIKSQIDVLNQDYRMKNTDVSSVPSPFTPLVADARVEFKLATKDPNGQTTDGIVRKQTNASGFGHDDSVKSAATGGADAWPADKYLNIWVCQLTGGLLGYAQFPGGSAGTDGVVILHSAFGTCGTAAAPFNLGRTATHEIGHWLNLRHIWGDDGNGCNGSDFVDDTPNQGGPNYDSPAFPHITCNNGPNGDLFMNYMDYVDDVAMFMFTAGQVDRMQACLDGDRNTIGEQKPGPSLKFTEDWPTLKSRDDIPTLKFREDIPQTLKLWDDLPTLKFREDIIQGPIQPYPPSVKMLDDVKSPALDKMPQQDMPKTPAGDQPGLPQPYGRRAAPFVLSTPHHSMAWMRSFPGAAQASAEAYVQQIRQYEELLNTYSQMEAAGQLAARDRQQADALYLEYTALVQEYRQLVGY